MRRPRRAPDSADLDMTPMLDIVFIMLIFFIVTASFVREIGIDVSRPDTPEQETPPQQAEVILLSIDQNSDVFLFELDDRDPGFRRIDERAVRANVERLYAENDERTVVIQPHRDADTGVLIRTLDQARLAGAPVAIGEVSD